MILFNILMLPPLVLVIMAFCNAPQSDIPIVLATIWWIAVAMGNIILYKIKKLDDKIKEK